MRGSNRFTPAEAKKINLLVRQKLCANPDVQKRIRKMLREKYNFYCTDFGGVTDFGKLIEAGKVIIGKSDGNPNLELHTKDLPGNIKNQHCTSDEIYVIDLCDKVLGLESSRQQRFSFLMGDSGMPLPVDAYYKEIELVVEYRERQHVEEVSFFDLRHTVSGVNRGEQRRIYDQRRRDVLPKQGIALVEISYHELQHNSRGRLLRTPEDVDVIKRKLDPFINGLGLINR